MLEDSQVLIDAAAPAPQRPLDEGRLARRVATLRRRRRAVGGAVTTMVLGVGVLTVAILSGGSPTVKFAGPSSPSEGIDAPTATERQRFEDHAAAWAQALIADDRSRLAELTTDDHQALVPGLRRMVASLGANVTANVWTEVEALQLDAPDDQLRSVCVEFIAESGDGRIRGGLMFGRVDNQWLAWEFRPDMAGCSTPEPKYEIEVTAGVSNEEVAVSVSQVEIVPADQVAVHTLTVTVTGSYSRDVKGLLLADSAVVGSRGGELHVVGTCSSMDNEEQRYCALVPVRAEPDEPIEFELRLDTKLLRNGLYDVKLPLDETRPDPYVTLLYSVSGGEAEGYPEGTVEDDVVTVAASDVHYGSPPPAFPAGTYELRLGNSGQLPHTLVNNELNISLRAEGRDRDSMQVRLPPGRHTFVCEIPGHAQTMQLTLRVDWMSPRWHAVSGASLYFYFSEPHERPHVAVRGKGWSCTVALDTFEVLAQSGAPSPKAVAAVIRLLREHHHLAIRAFHETAAHRFPGTLDDMKEAEDG